MSPTWVVGAQVFVPSSVASQSEPFREVNSELGAEQNWDSCQGVLTGDVDISNPRGICFVF